MQGSYERSTEKCPQSCGRPWSVCGCPTPENKMDELFKKEEWQSKIKRIKKIKDKDWEAMMRRLSGSVRESYPEELKA